MSATPNWLAASDGEGQQGARAAHGVGARSVEHRKVPSVLVVDDDLSIREALASILRDERFIVATARNGLEALELLRAGFHPTVVLLDVWMPELDGEATLAAMKAHRELEEIPVVLITAGNDARLGPNAKRASRIMRKPLDIDELLAALSEHVVRDLH